MTTTKPAWDLIGEEGTFRLPGGRATYEAVLYNDATARRSRVRLARLVATTPDGLRQVNRWVDWEQLIEVLTPESELCQHECGQPDRKIGSPS